MIYTRLYLCLLVKHHAEVYSYDLSINECILLGLSSQSKMGNRKGNQYIALLCFIMFFTFMHSG